MSHSVALRAQLRERAEAWATATGLPHYFSLGRQPTVMFHAAASGDAHGNFHPLSWTAIKARPDWAMRLEKPHSQKRALPEIKGRDALELDSSNSSDALLMNCFCYPNAVSTVLGGLGFPIQAGEPHFGFSPGIRLADGTTDATEIDMRVDSMFFEAKLTEANFTSRPKAHVFRYVALGHVFDVDRLPADPAAFHGYQLVRNVLAAHQHGASFVLLIDQRRPDLRSEWESVIAAVVDHDLASRCHVRTWQQVAQVAPHDLASFLETKYGL